MNRLIERDVKWFGHGLRIDLLCAEIRDQIEVAEQHMKRESYAQELIAASKVLLQAAETAGQEVEHP